MSDKPRFDISNLTRGGFSYWVVEENGIRVAMGLDERTAREFACAREMATVIKAMVANGIVGVATADIMKRLKCKGNQND